MRGNEPLHLEMCAGIITLHLSVYFRGIRCCRFSVTTAVVHTCTGVDTIPRFLFRRKLISRISFSRMSIFEIDSFATDFFRLQENVPPPQPPMVYFRSGCFKKGFQGLFSTPLFPAFLECSIENVPAGSPSRGGDVLDINQPSLPTPFTLILCLFLSYGPLPVFHSMNSPNLRSEELRTQKLKSHLVRTQLERSPFKAWSRSVCSHTCNAYCQGFFPCLFLPYRPIQLHFFQNLSRFLLYWLWLTHGSCVGPQNKIGHPARCRLPC